MSPTKIPGTMGLPVLGETANLVLDPYGYAARRYKRYGTIFKTRYFGDPTVILLGAEAQRYVFATNYRNFLWRKGYDFALPLYGDALFLTDGEPHDRARKLMTPAFHGKHMEGYLRRMNAVVDAQLSTMGHQRHAPVL